MSFGLPQKVEYCSNCVISNQRPMSVVEMKNVDNKKRGIEIEDSICSACRYALIKDSIDWGLRSEQLVELLTPYRSECGQFDVLVPCSGGKDSCFTAHILKHKYGMNPLTVTWDPGLPNEIGRDNLRNLSDVGGIPGIVVRPNGALHRELTREAFVNLGHPLQPFVHGQKVVAPKLAAQLGISLIVYGENQAEYGNDRSDLRSPFMDPKFFQIDDFYECVLGGRKVREFIDVGKFDLGDFQAYVPPSKLDIQNGQIKVTYLGYFEKWDPQECFYYAVENTGFKPASRRSCGTYSRYTELDDDIIPFHFYMSFIKFGLGRASYDAAQEIRNGKITREEAINLVKEFDGEQPSGELLARFLEYIQISEKDYKKTVDKFRPPHLWAKTNDGFAPKFKLV
jgi:N-acetyl sugar amidotransferase